MKRKRTVSRKHLGCNRGHDRGTSYENRSQIVNGKASQDNIVEIGGMTLGHSDSDETIVTSIKSAKDGEDDPTFPASGQLRPPGQKRREHFRFGRTARAHGLLQLEHLSGLAGYHLALKIARFLGKV